MLNKRLLWYKEQDLALGNVDTCHKDWQNIFLHHRFSRNKPDLFLKGPLDLKRLFLLL